MKRVYREKLTKQSVNSRGLYKYLKLLSDIKVKTDQGTFEKDNKRNGLKGDIAKLKNRLQIIRLKLLSKDKAYLTTASTN